MNGIDHVNNALQALFGGLEAKTEGIWNYVKLPNGLAVCWGIATATLTCSMSGLGGYFHPQGVYMDFPAGLFVEMPIGAAAVYGSSFAQSAQSRPLSKDQFYWNMVSQMSSPDIYTAHLIAVGRWK